MDRVVIRATLARLCMVSLTALAGTAVCAAVAVSNPAAPRFGSFGIDLAAQDKSVKPGDDFYRYVNGRWLATEKIPPDQSSWGPLEALEVQAELDVKAIIAASAGAHAAAGTNEQKIGDFYDAFLDRD